MNLPRDYWASYINVNNNLRTPNMKLQQTPSTDSLLARPNNIQGIFTPTTNGKRKIRYFFP